MNNSKLNAALNNKKILSFMKTENELNADILKITMDIKQDFPELVKYLNEMPVTIPNANSAEINTKALADYYDSLNVLVKDYALSHKHEGK